jgi:hypothetical protein
VIKFTIVLLTHDTRFAPGILTFVDLAASDLPSTLGTKTINNSFKVLGGVLKVSGFILCVCGVWIVDY